MLTISDRQLLHMLRNASQDQPRLTKINPITDKSEMYFTHSFTSTKYKIYNTK